MQGPGRSVDGFGRGKATAQGGSSADRGTVAKRGRGSRVLTRARVLNGTMKGQGRQTQARSRLETHNSYFT